MAERDGASREGYGDRRSLELAIKDAAKKAAGGVSRVFRAATIRFGHAGNRMI